MNRFARTGELTAPTQWVTSVGVSVRGGDRVADRDLVVVAADQDFADDEPQDALLLVERELVQAVAESGEEPFVASFAWAPVVRGVSVEETATGWRRAVYPESGGGDASP